MNEDPLSNAQPLSEKAESLAHVSLFKRLEADELERLATRVEHVTFGPDETIFLENDKGDALYVVDSGAVRIWVLDDDANPVTLAELKSGDFFGELAVLDRPARVADRQLEQLDAEVARELLGVVSRALRGVRRGHGHAGDALGPEGVDRDRDEEERQVADRIAVETDRSLGRRFLGRPAPPQLDGLPDEDGTESDRAAPQGGKQP